MRAGRLLFNTLIIKYKKIIENSINSKLPWWFVVIFGWISILFYYGIKLRNFLYDKGLLHVYYLPGVVISVGNIELGGVGKTPFVIFLASMIKAHDKSPVILIRGYKSGLRKYEHVILKNGIICSYYNGKKYEQFCTKKLFLDEALFQSKNLIDIPIIVGVNRIKAATSWMRYSNYVPSHWILDDGFQHRKIRRDVDIVLLSSINPFSNFRIFPLGFLREPISSLKRADIIVLSKCDAVQDYTCLLNEIQNVVKDKIILKSFIKYEAFEPLNSQAKVKNIMMTKVKLGLISAIAKPEFLINYLKRQGYDLAYIIIKPDHQKITKDDILLISKYVKVILTTYKDFYRDQSVFLDSNIAVFAIPMSVSVSSAEVNKLSKIIFDINYC